MTPARNRLTPAMAQGCLSSAHPRSGPASSHRAGRPSPASAHPHPDRRGAPRDGLRSQRPGPRELRFWAAGVTARVNLGAEREADSESGSQRGRVLISLPPSCRWSACSFLCICHTFRICLHPGLPGQAIRTLTHALLCKVSMIPSSNGSHRIATEWPALAGGSTQSV